MAASQRKLASSQAQAIATKAAGEVGADPGWMAVVVRGLDCEAPGLRTGFGDQSLPPPGLGGGFAPKKPKRIVGLGKREPIDHEACEQSGICCSSSLTGARRRVFNSSTAARCGEGGL